MSVTWSLCNRKCVTVIRKKDLCKMRHGEYIALGKIEAILKTCAAVSNIVVYGSGTFIIFHRASVAIER